MDDIADIWALLRGGALAEKVKQKSTGPRFRLRGILAAMEDLGHILDLLRGANLWDTLWKTTAALINLRSIVLSIPRGACSEAHAGAPPDYAILDSWLAHPRRAPGAQAVEDPNHLTTPCSHLPSVEHRPCDCFFVVDSCCTPAEAKPFVSDGVARSWNLPLGEHKEDTPAQLFVAKTLEQMRMRTAANASCYNRTCRIYAPVYRQTPVLAFAHLPALARGDKSHGILWPSEAELAFQVAYDDVRRAFVRFVDDPLNAERPFVVAGHSQGTLHLVRLLQEEIEGHPARLRRFVHAYLPGFGVPLGLFSRCLRSIGPSRHASDTGTVSSWRTAAPGHPRLGFLTAGVFYAGEGWRGIDGETLATNPVTWTAGPEPAPSDPALHRGAAWPLPSNLDPREHAAADRHASGVALRLGGASSRSRRVLGVRIHRLLPVDCGPVTARVDGQGLLRVPALRASSLFGLTARDYLLYHDLDCALFHHNLQENVAVRVAAWRSSRRS